MDKNRYIPLAAEQRHRIKAAMESSISLAEIAQETNVSKIIEYMLEDRPLLERYLISMAATLSQQRQQISCRLLILAVFHCEKSKLSLYNKNFLALLTITIDREREIQKRVFIAQNHLQADIRSDVWKIYEKYGDILRLKTINFLSIRCHSLRHEMKYYLRYMFECAGKVNVPLFACQYMALNALVEVNPRIKFFADITEADAKSLLLFLENTHTQKSETPLSQYYIAKAMNSVKRVIAYLMGSMRDSEIRAPRPHMNPFDSFTFRNLREYNTSTSAISEDVIEQINNYSEELPPLHKLLYDIFAGTGLRLKEVFFLEADCIEPSRYAGICQLKFKPHKVLAARRRHGAGDYHRIMIPQALADKISSYIDDTSPIRESCGSSYIFLSQRPGYSTAVMDSLPFIKSVRGIIEKYDIRDEDGELWHFTSRQFRKTIAVTLIENGATTAELAYWLGHMCSDTAAKYYAEVRKMKLAGLNTKFYREKFDLILSGEQLETYTEEERRLLYVDFRLEKRRVELGFCLIKAADGPCPNRSSLYNCVNCKNLCTGKKYLSYWDELLTQQKAVFEKLIACYHANSIKNYTDFAEYKQELCLLNGYENIVSAIKEGGGSRG